MEPDRMVAWPVVDREPGGLSFSAGNDPSALVRLTLETRRHPFLAGQLSIGKVSFEATKAYKRQNPTVERVAFVFRETAGQPWHSKTVGPELWRFDVELNDGSADFEVMIPEDIGLPGFRLASPNGDSLIMRQWYIEFDVILDGADKPTFTRQTLRWDLWRNQATLPFPDRSEITAEEGRAQATGRTIRILSCAILLGVALMLTWYTNIFVIFLTLPLAIVIYGYIDEALRTKRQRLLELMTSS